jgi:hypothetical protein
VQSSTFEPVINAVTAIMLGLAVTITSSVVASSLSGNG